MDLIAKKMESIRSDIRGRNYHVALDLEKKGEKILKLNTGNPAAFGFGMPDSVRNALMEKMDTAVGYCDVRGMVPAREAIFAYHKSKGVTNFSMDDIFVGNGVSEIASMISTVLINPGDEVLMPTPCYSLWVNEVILNGGVPVYYRCDEENEWNPDIEHIKSLVNERTKAILIINPNNPTGALYSNDILLEIAEIARQNDLIVFADEIYDRLVYDGLEHVSFAKLAPDLTIVTMNGLSKSHCLCGFRCGWMVISGAEEIRSKISENLLKVASVRLSANALMQTIIPAALADTEFPKSMISEGGRLYEQRKATCDQLDKIESISYVKSKASLYVFPKIKKEYVEIVDDREFAYELLQEKHILIVPGSGFNYATPDHFRIVMLPEAKTLGYAVEQIGDFLNKRSKK